MSKSINYKILDFEKLKIEILENASSGDYIDLYSYIKDISKVSLDFNSKFLIELKENIKKDLDVEYENNLNNEMDIYRNKLMLSYIEEKENIYNECNDKFNKLNQEYITLKENFNLSLQNNLNVIIKKIENEKNDVIENLNQENNNLNLEIVKLRNQINLLYLEKSNSLLECEKKIRDEKQKEIDKIVNDYNLLKNEYEILSRSKKILGTKKLGNDLEQWCASELNNIFEFDESVVVRPARLVEGTKADYEIEIINQNQKCLILLEMKTEDKDSIYKKTTSSYAKKLFSDCKKVNADFGLLVTELDPEELYIVKKDKTYNDENIFFVRPVALVHFVLLIKSFFMKSSNLINKLDNNIVSFKDKQQILDEFEDFKNDILDKQINNINKKLNSIADEANSIIKSAEKIKSEIGVVLDSHFEAIKNKINKFNIKKIAKKTENNYE